MRQVVFAVVLAACSSSSSSQEIDASGTSSGDDASVGDDASTIDASPDAAANACAGGDGVCLASCTTTDPDCTKTCGDNVCVGNAGELCGNCASDCAKLTMICGNGQCQAGESPSCYADCGPAPWTWSTEEMQLATLVNNARTQGFACPGMATVTRPAFTIDDALKAGAREWVWELAHEDYFNSGNGCNGRTLAQRKTDGGNFTGYLVASGYTTVQMTFAAWMADATLCPIVMSGVVTRASFAVALDTTNKGYIVVMK